MKLRATYEFVWSVRTAHDKVSFVKAVHALALGGDEAGALSGTFGGGCAMLELWPGKDQTCVGGTHAGPVRGGATPMAPRETFAKAARVG